MGCNNIICGNFLKHHVGLIKRASPLTATNSRNVLRSIATVIEHAAN